VILPVTRDPSLPSAAICSNVNADHTLGATLSAPVLVQCRCVTGDTDRPISERACGGARAAQNSSMTMCDATGSQTTLTTG
jgi:hypothetical protein